MAGRDQTAADRAAALADYLKAQPSYDVSQIITTPINGGSAEYLSRVVAQT